VLWWLVHERGWSIRVTDHHQPLWQRQLRPDEDQQPALAQENEQQQQDPAKEAREIMLRRDIAGQSAIAAQWLINAGFWGGEPPKSLTSLPCY
jgi:rhodanese-related sulfurtransferase